MRRHIPGLHSGQQDLVSNLDGLFLVRVELASCRWHPQKPFERTSGYRRSLASALQAANLADKNLNSGKSKSVNYKKLIDLPKFVL
jgi:hypothetical protein